jgi:hypothetical protein
MILKANSESPRLPNFFIVGAAKSGTTSLADYLGQHPDIYMSPVKEPFFFVPDTGLKDYGEYLKLFKKSGDAKAVGEASTGYLFDESAARSLRKHFPDARIIIILRNPVNMAFSYWQYMQVIGNEAKSFEEAISERERAYRMTEEFKRSCVNWWASYIYLDRALYFGQVKRYLDLFGRQRVKVYVFEEFFADLPRYCRDVFEFLGVAPDFTPDFRVVNEGGVVRSQLIKKIRNGRYPIAKRVLPLSQRQNLRNFLLRINLRKDKRVSMPPETRLKLEAFFQEDIWKLERLLRRDILAWMPKQCSIVPS